MLEKPRDEIVKFLETVKTNRMCAGKNEITRKKQKRSKMKFLVIALVLLICINEMLAGSECPTSAQLYPCRCINHKLTRRKILTFVVCNSIPNTDVLNSIFPTLSTMRIDKFIMYDSYWQANILGASGSNKKILPTNWLTTTNIKEMEVIDTTLSSCFACQWNLPCRNTFTTKLKIVNSTSPDKMCTMCSPESVARAPWIICMSNLEHFEVTYGNLKSEVADFFPLAFGKLKTLILSHNQIAKIERTSFTNLPELKNLDLSYNVIESIDYVFINNSKLEYIDISFNKLKMIGSNLLPYLPKIKSLNFAHNSIKDFRRSDWRMTPVSLRTIDLTGNPIKCDCNLKWVNLTFKVHVNIPGTCSESSPAEYHNSNLRTASTHLSKRCNDNGQLGARN